MRKYLKLQSNKIKMLFQFWSNAIILKLGYSQASKQQHKLFSVKFLLDRIRPSTRMFQYCHDEKYTLNFFQILKRCHTEHETKIQEALLIQKPVK